MLKKRILICVIAVITISLITITLFQSNLSAATTSPNYAEALQKSLYFYDANKCGSGILGGKLEWRGDCHLIDKKIKLSAETTNLKAAFIEENRQFLDPDGDGCMDLSGGFHDAGDFVKFGLPQTYSASTLSWGYYRFKDAFVKIGEEDHIKDIIKWFSDYFLKSTFTDKQGNVVAFSYMVGEGASDHVVWIAPELQDTIRAPRPADFSSPDTPASDQVGGASAALALAYLNFKDSDPEYADKCLKAAKSLYVFGKKYRGLGNGDGFYGSIGDEDELSWAATWLYHITKDMNYIDDIMKVDSNGKITGFFARQKPTVADEWQNSWVHCWDAVWGGVFTELAGMFPENKEFDEFARWNLEYWTGGKVKHQQNGGYVKTSPKGFSVISTWGSARYNAGAQMCAMVYQKFNKNKTDLTDWAKSQMDYILGDNPMGYAYEVGYGEKSAKHPHHRAAHGSLVNDAKFPAEHKHTLWGALVGGPDADDFHKDITEDYVYNEVAIDYNAAFVGALAGQYLMYGSDQKPIPNFPPKEERKNEYYVEAKLESMNDQLSEIHVLIHSENMTPPTPAKDLSLRYFFNISELTKIGQTIKDVYPQLYYDETSILHNGKCNVKGPIKWDDNGTYYVEFDWIGSEVLGTRELQFVVVARQDTVEWNTHWDGTNDYSQQDLTKKYVLYDKIPLYKNGVLVYGVEPGSKPTASQTTQVSPSPSTSTTDILYGDVNGDKKVTSTDVALIERYTLGSVNFTATQITSADVNFDSKITSTDISLVERLLLGVIDKIIKK